MICSDRHYQAGKLYNASAVIKIPSDCPLIDPRVIDRVITLLSGPSRPVRLREQPASGHLSRRQRCGIIAMEALATAHREAARPLEREHTTPFLWENPHRFPHRQRHVGNWTGLFHEPSLDHRLQRRLPFHRRRLRWTIRDDPLFGPEDILNFLATHQVAAPTAVTQE